jgi:hypothetical protein
MKKTKIDHRDVISTTWFILFVVMLYRLGFTIFLFAEGCVHANRYTYWNYVGQTLFYIILSIFYVFKDTRPFKFFSLIFFPMVFGSVFLVLFYIIVVLYLDHGWLFISATIEGGGQYSAGTVHTFDMIVHVFTVVDLLLVLTGGYIADLRKFYQNTTFHQYLFFVYFFLTPLIPVGIYSIFYNPIKEYPVDTASYVPILIGIALHSLVTVYIYNVIFSKKYGHFLKKSSSSPPNKKK